MTAASPASSSGQPLGTSPKAWTPTIFEPRIWMDAGRVAPGVTTRRLRTIRSGRNGTSQADDVQFDLPISVLARPCRQRRAGDFIHQPDGHAEARQVDTFEVLPARVARFDANVIERGRLDVREFALV